MEKNSIIPIIFLIMCALLAVAACFVGNTTAQIALVTASTIMGIVAVKAC